MSSFFVSIEQSIFNQSLTFCFEGTSFQASKLLIVAFTLSSNDVIMYSSVEFVILLNVLFDS